MRNLQEDQLRSRYFKRYLKIAGKSEEVQSILLTHITEERDIVHEWMHRCKFKRKLKSQEGITHTEKQNRQKRIICQKHATCLFSAKKSRDFLSF